MTFAAKLKSERQRLGLSQADAARLLDMSAEWVSKCERDLTVPLLITQEGALVRLAKIKKALESKAKPNQKLTDAPRSNKL
jgi:transcriptional regulator with XRE-family HTH domain